MRGRALTGLAMALALTGIGFAQEAKPTEGEKVFEEGMAIYESDQGGAATPYFRRAAEAGDPRAMWFYGMALINGEGVKVDEAEAYVWVRRAAEAGDVNGQISTAVMLATAQGVEEDDPQARRWYQLAVDQGSPVALVNLAGMLLTGEGGDFDETRGLAYLELATDTGDERAAAMLTYFGPPTPGRREEVDAIKRDWLKAHPDFRR